jgi:hypothetical protein
MTRAQVGFLVLVTVAFVLAFLVERFARARGIDSIWRILAVALPAMLAVLAATGGLFLELSWAEVLVLTAVSVPVILLFFAGVHLVGRALGKASARKD